MLTRLRDRSLASGAAGMLVAVILARHYHGNN